MIGSSHCLYVICSMSFSSCLLLPPPTACGGGGLSFQYSAPYGSGLFLGFYSSDPSLLCCSSEGIVFMLMSICVSRLQFPNHNHDLFFAFVRMSFAQ